MSVNVSSPRLIEQFIAKDVRVVLEPLGHFSPKVSKAVLNLLFIIVETLPIIMMITGACKKENDVIRKRNVGGVIFISNSSTLFTEYKVHQY